MKHYAFILTMPGRNTWNGKWTGDKHLYVKCKSFRDIYEPFNITKIGESKTFGYDFGDGWFASIEVKRIESVDKTKLMKQSKGFCGYEWMISSIIKHGEIRKPK